MGPMTHEMVALGAAPLMTVGPFIAVLVAMVAGTAWIARRAAEEVRRTAAEDWERRLTAPRPSDLPRMAT